MNTQIYITVKCIDGLNLGTDISLDIEDSITDIWPIVQKIAINLAIENKISLRDIAIATLPFAYTLNETKTFRQLEPKEILETIVDEYFNDQSWLSAKINYEQSLSYEDFLFWLNCKKLSWKKIETGEKSFLKLLKIECGYSDIFDMTQEIAKIIKNKLSSKNTNTDFIEYNTEKFIQYLNKFSQEDKVKMLLEIAKFIGEDNLKELLQKCKAFTQEQHTKITDRLDNLIFQLPDFQKN